MPQLALRTAVDESDAKTERSTPDESLWLVDRFRHMDDFLQPGLIDEWSGPQANSVPSQVFTRGERSPTAAVIDLAPTEVRTPASASFHALQEWEGHVLEVQPDQFLARLVDLTASAVLDSEQAEIPREELSEADDVKLRVGGIFRLVIGYERSPGGTKKRVSQIVFRDLPVITNSDLREGEAWASEVVRSLSP